MNNNNLQNKSITTILTVITIAIIFLSPIFNQPLSTSLGVRPADVGFQDGLSDCQTGTSNAINGHSNAGHHSAAYIAAYNRGLVSCSKLGSNTNKGFTSSNTATAAAPATPIAPLQSIQQQQQAVNQPSPQAPITLIPVITQPTSNVNNNTIQSSETTLDFNSICNILQTGLYDSCRQLVDQNGNLTAAGNTNVKCIITSALLNVGATVLQIQPSFINNTLTNFSNPTGCGGVVKIDQLNNLLSATGNMKGIINQLLRFIH